ncbi:NTP/NDP exchange transporter [Terriglobus albidus]|nr:Npt1/Npt2 family nucleotide transporter [Terriglobus albidus]
MGASDTEAGKMSFATTTATDTPPLGSDLQPRKSLLEKTLSIISDVQPGEGLGALILTINLFTLLGAYYLLKTVRESLILAEGGAEVKAYSSAAQAIILLGVVPLYGWIATHLNRNRLLRFTTLFFASNLIIFYLVGRTGTRIGIVYYIWVGIFNVFSVAQLWSFATDLFSQSQGKRLFPLLGVGASAGAVGGAWIAGRLIGPLGPYKIILISAAVICVCSALTRLAGYVITKRAGEQEKKKDTETLSSEGGFQLLMRDRYLLLIAILTVLLNIVSLSGDFIFGKLLVNQTNEVVGTAASLMKARKAYIGSYYASYYEWTNLVSFIIQTFLVSRIFKRIGVRGSLFVLPAISLATFVTILASPILRVVRVLKIAENSTNYSLQNTVRHALLLPTSREAKYKVKAAIETFCVRLGDVLQAGVIFVGTALHFNVRAFATMTLVITVLWLFVAYRLYIEHKHLAPECH